MQGYLYLTTHKPTGFMYAGSRKGTPDGDSYMGSPTGRNIMRGLLEACDPSEFEKEVLYVSDYDSIAKDEPALIRALMDQYGSRITNICVAFPFFSSGYKHSSETCKKIAEGHKGKKLSSKHKAKLREINLGEKNPNYGLRRSSETRRKTSESLMGHKVSAEARRKMSESSRKEVVKTLALGKEVRYASAKECAKYEGYSHSSISRWARAEKNGFRYA